MGDALRNAYLEGWVNEKAQIDRLKDCISSMSHIYLYGGGPCEISIIEYQDRQFSDGAFRGTVLSARLKEEFILIREMVKRNKMWTTTEDKCFRVVATGENASLKLRVFALLSRQRVRDDNNDQTLIYGLLYGKSMTDKVVAEMSRYIRDFTGFGSLEGKVSEFLLH